MTLTDEQTKGLNAIVEWLKSEEREFGLGGYAGTGKTTLIQELVESTGIKHVVAAFTGKACHVLQRKGVRAHTLHSLMYRPFEDEKGKLCFDLREVLSVDDKLIDDDLKTKLIIVDESSMISRQLYDDLKTFGTKLLFVGDPGQLEPIGDNPNLMASPDYVLQTIHRQAAENPILRLAHEVRAGGTIKLDGPEDDRLIFVTRAEVNKHLGCADQVICAMNKTRIMINEAFRKAKSCKHLLEPGEKLICLRNNRRLGVFNGMMFLVKEILKEKKNAWSCLVDMDGSERQLDIWKDPFKAPHIKVEQVPYGLVYCDYAYCITCHKAQGSEWDNVLVVDEWTPPRLWSPVKWRYTAITRAAQKLRYVRI